MRGENVITIAILIVLLCAANGFAQEKPGAPKLTPREGMSQSKGLPVLSLQQGLRMVINQNRLVKIAERQQQVRAAQTRIALAPMLPEVNGSAGQTFLDHQPKAMFNQFIVPESDKDYYSYSLSVSQTIFDFEGNASRYGASKALLAASKYGTLQTKNLVALRFAIAYFNLLESDKMVHVAKEEVARLKTHLADAQNLYTQGVITKNDLLQAEVRISDARRKLVDARNTRAIASSRVNSLLARPLTTKFEPVDVPASVVFYNTAGQGKNKKPNLTQAWATAQKKRPELAVIAEDLKSLGLEKKAAKSEYFPRFFAQGGYDYTKNRYLTPNGNFSLLFGMNINLYGGGITKAEIEQDEARKSRLLEQKDRVTDDIRLEVQTYALDLEDALKRIEVTKDAVKQAKENLRINKIRYEQGVGTATDVIDALTLLTVAETNRYSALYDFRKAEAGFLYAQGYDLAEVYR